MSIAARVAEKLAGHKVPDRGGNYLVKCPAHEDDSPSLSLRDGKRGLLVHCFARCSPSEVFIAIRRIDGGLLQPGQTAPQAAKGSTEYGRRQHEKAAWLWSKRRPIAGSIAERYLREARAVTCDLPPTLAFLPPVRPAHKPAMIAAFGFVDEPEPGVLSAPIDVNSVHLTLLKPDGGGKSEDNPNKLEPISKSFEEDDEAGKLDKAEEVVSVVLPANEDPALPLNPGEEALDKPPSHVAA
jgi:hypothetical protein